MRQVQAGKTTEDGRMKEGGSSITRSVVLQCLDGKRPKTYTSSGSGSCPSPSGQRSLA
ncbi:hypothetical protein DAPPUDRAFT_253084 [Daphnia pulex]|uniref:Uncharacterized protein n=1 Tax=Daphnia pulex TaxID=6669 RepID=E9H453_DAPPU|nr:hypothetical protein DAPPUDRAFT_253084 [Daphnia pulex]|eukprot:EFX73453.1 hypothetical protein DAPPUDRAFT_253084 [Daphnia pulex]